MDSFLTWEMIATRYRIFMSPERVFIIFFNIHDANFASWHFFIYQTALLVFRNSQNAKFLVVAVPLMPQRVVVVFPLIERYRSLGVTHIYSNVHCVIF